ncbi:MULTISPECIES: cytochrome c oxidase assembly protein [Robertmurraya]|uniref:Cytochrome c oxidase assembly protein n=1 Tax=Robertmurraya beringensis TaxID=641660 RepID=A0ABV6KZM0_9BACI
MNMQHKALSELYFEWNIPLIIVCLAIAFLYEHKRKTMEFHLTKNQKISFHLGVSLLAVSLGSPLNSVGHYLFSVHMFIQSIIYLAVPPLILFGLPKKEVGKLINKYKIVRKTIHIVTKPVLAILLFNVVFSFYHVPFIFDFIMGNQLYINLSILFLFFLSFIMWWPILPPVDSIEGMKPLYKIAYICGMGILLTPACALIIFSKDILYSSYMHMPRLFGIGTLDDQQAGGALMKIIQEAIYGSVLAVIFFKWAKEQRNLDLESEIDRKEEEYLQKFRNIDTDSLS